jgi:hypothetical protein
MRKAPRGGAGLFAVVLLISRAAAPAFAQLSVWGDNEIRGAKVKDRIRAVQAGLKAESDYGRRLSALIGEAFQGTRDGSAAAEAYFARRGDLLARAEELDAELDRALAGNMPEQEDHAKAVMEAIRRKVDALRDDCDFFVHLPAAASGQDRKNSQAAMRLLSETGVYELVREYFRYWRSHPARP